MNCFGMDWRKMTAMKQRSFDVTALGELLIDFTENGISGQGNPLFEANPGGAPCNVLSMLARLGKKVSFIGKVGNDMFGHQLRQAVTEQGINTDGLKMDDEVHTTLAFVHTMEGGDRDFSFYRKPGADIELTAEEVDEERIRDSRIFHFGTLSLTDEPARSATRTALSYAEKAGCIRSFDPNLRPPLWNDLEEAKVQVAWGLEHCDVLKISDNEIQWFTGLEDFDEGIRVLSQRYPNIRLICLSMGKDGSTAYFGNTKAFAEAFVNPDTIETTGAGDTFCACVLNYLLDHDLVSLTPDQLGEMLHFANAAASLVTTKKGALRVMPTQQQVEEYMRNYQK